MWVELPLYHVQNQVDIKWSYNMIMNLAVINVGPREKPTVPVVPRTAWIWFRSSGFVAESLNDTTVPNIIDKDIIISEAYWHCIKKNDKYM